MPFHRTLPVIGTVIPPGFAFAKPAPWPGARMKRLGNRVKAHIGIVNCCQKMIIIFAIGLTIQFIPSGVGLAAEKIGLYETWEIEVINSKKYSNPFDFKEIELRASFHAPSGKTVSFFGFFDGNGSGNQSGTVWKLRFMPDEQGTWSYSYSWSDGTSGGSGSFQVGERVNPKNHGHVHVDPDHTRYLVYDDGTPHYFYGANWIDSWRSLAQIIAWLDTLEEYGHNGFLMKTALYPLMDDKFTWNLAMMRDADTILKEALARGIYVQVNCFDTWARTVRGTDEEDGRNHVFNVWESGDEAAKENYIKTLIARYAGYPNVYWELGNEMEHSPNSGSAFVSQANDKYIPWFTQHDPYDLPLGLSEGVWKKADVDIGFLHQTDSLPSTSWTKPTIMNELVSGGVTGTSLWKDAAMRNSKDRLSYRRTFWRMFTYGGSGSSETTWYEWYTTANAAAKDVMSDQQRLRNFMETLPININEMNTDTSFVAAGPGSFRTRRKMGDAYVTYFLLDPSQSRASGNITVALPKGSYEISWFDPKSGATVDSAAVNADGGAITLSHPEFFEDIVLLVLRQGLSDHAELDPPTLIDVRVLGLE